MNIELLQNIEYKNIREELEIWKEIFDRAKKKGNVKHVKINDWEFEYAIVNNEDEYNEDKNSMGRYYKFTGEKIKSLVKENKQDESLAMEFGSLSFVFGDEVPEKFRDFVGLHEYIHTEGLGHAEAVFIELTELFKNEEEFISEYTDWMFKNTIKNFIQENNLEQLKKRCFGGVKTNFDEMKFVQYLINTTDNPSQIFRNLKNELEKKLFLILNTKSRTPEAIISAIKNKILVESQEEFKFKIIEDELKEFNISNKDVFFETEEPYFDEPLNEEFEEVDTPFLYDEFVYVFETALGKKFYEKYPYDSEEELKINETPDFINEFFESNILKYAILKGILNKNKFIIPSIKLNSDNEFGYYSEFIPNIISGSSEYIKNQNYAISFLNNIPIELVKKLPLEEYNKLNKKSQKMLDVLWENFGKKENAVPLFLIHILCGDFNKKENDYAFQIDKNQNEEIKFKIIILEMSRKDYNKNDNYAVNLLEKYSIDEITEYWLKIKKFFNEKLVENIINKIPFKNELTENKKREVLNNIKNMEKLILKY